jgi:high-affinity iron transporter
MLPTFVIGLREGLEASFIVSIVAAFLRQRGRSDLLRWVLVGVFAAIAVCAAAGVTLDVVSRSLPQRQQEGLETVIGLVAVAMVTCMVVWMKRHSRELKGRLDRAAGAALAGGSGVALVAMAFLAVLREGLETVVFLLAAFNESGSGDAAAAGAVLGILAAVALGYAIYRGGVRLNLSRFFRVTGVVLVLVAAGLLVNALHTAHEAGWLDIGQQSTFDLSAVVEPGTVRASLLTGMLGLQSQPVLVEVVGWLLYFVPISLYVAWPPGRTPSRPTIARIGVAVGAAAAVTAVILGLFVPGRPGANPTTVGSGVVTHLVSTTGHQAVIATGWQRPAQPDARSIPVRLVAQRAGTDTMRGVARVVYRVTRTSTLGGATTMGLHRLAALGGGRLPLGAVGPDGTTIDGRHSVPVTRRSVDQLTFWVADDTGRVVDLRWVQRISLVAHFDIGDTVVGAPRTASAQLSASESAWAAAEAGQDAATLDRRAALINLTGLFAAAAAVSLLVALVALVADRRRPPSVPTDTRSRVSTPTSVG